MASRYELISANAATWERRLLNGRPHWVGPATMIVPGVLNGSKGPLLYPAEEIIRSVPAWNGMPITDGHPKDSSGNYTSARQPQVLDQYQLGTVFAAKYDGKLNAEAWIDEELARKKRPEILASIKANKLIGLSTGLGTEDEDSPGVYNGQSGQRDYRAIARNYTPDHLAVLLNQRGACSIEDGCGLGVNGEALNHGDPSSPDYPHGGGAGGKQEKMDAAVKKMKEAKARLPKSYQKYNDRQIAALTSQSDTSSPSVKEAAKDYLNAKAAYGNARDLTDNEHGHCSECGKEDCECEVENFKLTGTGKADEPLKYNLLSRMWQAALNAFNPDQPRGEDGKWGDSGGGASGPELSDSSTDVQKSYPHLAHLLNGVKEVKPVASKGAAKALVKEMRAKGTFAALFKDPKGGKGAKYLVVNWDEESTENAFLPNQPRSEVTGKIKKRNAGQGKGEGHEAAQQGYYGGLPNHKKPGTEEVEEPVPTMNYVKEENGKFCVYSESGEKLGEHESKAEAEAQLRAIEASKAETVNEELLQEGDDMNRKEGIAFLVNCDCSPWKGKESVLNEIKLFSDKEIMTLVDQLKTNQANALVVNALSEKLGDKAPALNAMPAFIKEKIDAKKDPEEEEEEEEEEEAPMTKGTMNLANLTPQQVDQLSKAMFGAPVAVVNAGLTFAKSAEKARRKELVDKLIANAVTPEQKKIAANIYGGLPLEQLESLASTIPAVRNMEQEERSYVYPSQYIGDRGSLAANAWESYSDADLPPEPGSRKKQAA